jgi:hypothetical protein
VVRGAVQGMHERSGQRQLQTAEHVDGLPDWCEASDCMRSDAWV